MNTNKLIINKKNKKIIVSDHAIVRYLERVYGVDINKLKKMIITEEMEDLINKFNGYGKFPGDGYSVQMKDYYVVTVYKNKKKLQKKRK